MKIIASSTKLAGYRAAGGLSTLTGVTPWIGLSRIGLTAGGATAEARTWFAWLLASCLRVYWISVRVGKSWRRHTPEAGLVDRLNCRDRLSWLDSWNWLLFARKDSLSKARWNLSLGFFKSTASAIPRSSHNKLRKTILTNRSISKLYQKTPHLRGVALNLEVCWWSGGERNTSDTTWMEYNKENYTSLQNHRLLQKNDITTMSGTWNTRKRLQ